MTTGFTIDGSSDLEARLERTCDEVLAGVRALVPASKLEALVLGGGYGRGQGGVLKTPSGDQPYNDLEFYVFLRGNRVWNERRFQPPLAVLGEQLSPEAGLHVEFKVDSLARFRRSPVSMFSYDLVSRHRVLWTGFRTPGGLFAGCRHHVDAGRIPAVEGTRLLFNRCSGLLLAKEMLKAGSLAGEQADFVGRNISKAQLALGDSVLAACGRYHWSCLERRNRLALLLAEAASAAPEGVDPDALLRHHAAGVEFKLHPWRAKPATGLPEARLKSGSRREEALTSPENPEEIRDSSPRLLPNRQLFDLPAAHREVSELASRVWLWLESRRLDRRFATAREYAFSPVKKCAGAPAWRNLLLNLRSLRGAALLDPMALRYPRGRLLNTLPLLLWEDPASDPKATRHLQRQLQTVASDWQALVAAYKNLWPSFS